MISLKQIIQKILPKNKFARSVSILAGGTFAGQAIMILVAPLLTRLYAPEDFGMLAIYASILSMIGVISSLRYQLAIPLPEKDEEGLSLVALCLVIVFFMAFLSVGIVMMYRQQIANLLNAPLLSNYLWLLPPGLFLMGVYQVFNYWAFRIKAYPLVARTKLTQSISLVGVQLLGYGLGPFALLLGHICGQSAGVISLGMVTIRNNWQQIVNIRLKNIVSVAKWHWRFPAFSIWTGLSSSGARQLPPILIAIFFGVGAAGFYALAHRILSVPMTLIGKAVGDVFYSEAAEANRKGRLGEMVASIHKHLVAAALPAAILFLVTAPDIFSLVFGNNWTQAGKMAQIMTPWLYFHIVVSPATMIFPILDKHNTALIFQFSKLLASIVSLWIGAYLLQDVLLAILILSISNSLIYLSRLIQSFNITGANPWLIARNAIDQIVPVSIVVFPYLFLHNVSMLLNWHYFISFLGLMVSYSLLAVILVRYTKKGYK